MVTKIYNKKQLNESGLSRLQAHIKDHDCVCISAYKNAPDKEPTESDEEYQKKLSNYTRASNNRDTRMLLTELKTHHYFIISIKGFYKYDSASKSEKENSFAVINANNDSDFEKTMLDIAKDYKQESILYIHSGTCESEYIYTGYKGNHHYGDTEPMGIVHFGTELLDKSDKDNPDGSRILSRVNGRPFASFDMSKTRQSETDSGVYIDEGYAPVIDSKITRNDISYLKYKKGLDETTSKKDTRLVLEETDEVSNNINEDIDKIIEKIPTIGYIDKKTGYTVLPADWDDPEDAYWDEE
jgi:hypothetical protein